MRRRTCLARWLEHGRVGVPFVSPVYNGDQVRAVLRITGEYDDFAAEFQCENGVAAVASIGRAG